MVDTWPAHNDRKLDTLAWTQAMGASTVPLDVSVPWLFLTHKQVLEIAIIILDLFTVLFTYNRQENAWQEWKMHVDIE